MNLKTIIVIAGAIVAVVLLGKARGRNGMDKGVTTPTGPVGAHGTGR